MFKNYSNMSFDSTIVEFGHDKTEFQASKANRDYSVNVDLAAI